MENLLISNHPSLFTAQRAITTFCIPGDTQGGCKHACNKWYDTPLGDDSMNGKLPDDDSDGNKLAHNTRDDSTHDGNYRRLHAHPAYLRLHGNVFARWQKPHFLLLISVL